MKYDVVKRKIETNGENATKIKLKSGSKAFKILFGSIYKDIIKALVRELFTNAWDSQKMAGNLDIPIEIHAPSKFEPYFSIRDYGTGMTPQVVKDIYSMVFASTKDESNDQAGFMGMGSKTPLGYSDIFSLVSYVDGKYYAYEIYSDEDGDPVINPQGEGDTEEKNGIFIQLPVEGKDITHFSKMINDFVVMSDANVKVDGKKIHNNMEIIFKSSNGNFTYNSDIFSGVYLKMGCVLYPYDAKNVYGNSVPTGINLIMDFPIGSFEVTASRDDIIYNDSVKSLINETFKAFKEEYKAFFEKEVSQFKTYLEANEFYISHGDFFRKCFGYGARMAWRGRYLQSSSYENIDYPKTRGFTVYPIETRWGAPKPQIKRSARSIKCNKNRNACNYIAFFDNGNNTNVHYKITRYIQMINDGKYYDKDKIFVYIKGDNRKCLNFLLLTYKLGITDIVDIQNLSDLKKPKKVIENKIHTMRRLNSSGGVGFQNYTMEKLTDEKYYYVHKNTSVQEVENAVKYLMIDITKVIYAYEKDMRFIKKHPDNFIDIVSKTKDEISKLDLQDNEIDGYIIRTETSILKSALLKIILHDQNIDKSQNVFDIEWLSSECQDKIKKRKEELDQKVNEYENKKFYEIFRDVYYKMSDTEYRANFISLMKKAGEIE